MSDTRQRIPDGEHLTLEQLMSMGPMAPVRNPHVLFERLRNEGPMTPLPNGSYLVTRYDTARDVLRDDTLFSSAIVQRTMGAVLGESLVGMDGRDHLRHRALVTPALAPRALRGDFPKLVERIAHRTIDRFANAGEADVSAQFTFLYPLAVFVEILGLPAEDVPDFHNWGIDLTMVAHDPPRGITASQKMLDYLLPVVRRKRRAPAGDLISSLARAEVEGVALSDEEVVSFLRLLVVAGAETTYHLMGTALFVMLRDLELQHRVRADRRLVPVLLDEALRWESPISTVMREATRDTEIAGVPIAKDTGLIVSIGSANRDERKFEEPARFRLDRGESEHIAFGLGKHYCAGSRLALLEAEVGMNALLDRLAQLEPQPGEDHGIVGFNFRGPDRLPVRFKAT